jgi:hypothetical protein
VNCKNTDQALVEVNANYDAIEEAVGAFNTFKPCEDSAGITDIEVYASALLNRLNATTEPQKKRRVAFDDTEPVNALELPAIEQEEEEEEDEPLSHWMALVLAFCLFIVFRRSTKE